jgi:hypothetical protein
MEKKNSATQLLDRILSPRSPQFGISQRSSMVVSPEPAKSAILNSRRSSVRNPQFLVKRIAESAYRVNSHALRVTRLRQMKNALIGLLAVSLQ